MSTSGRRISISGHSAWSLNDATSTDTCSGGVATPTSDISPPRSSPVDDESRDHCESIITRITSPLTAEVTRGSVDTTASTTGPSIPAYRSTVAAETFRRGEPTHFHWTSTSTSASARPRPSTDPVTEPKTYADLISVSNDPLLVFTDISIDFCVSATKAFHTSCDCRHFLCIQSSKFISIHAARYRCLFFFTRIFFVDF